MNTTIAIILAQSLNLAAFIFLAFWYAVPWLKSSSRVNALTALILVHLGRTLALQLYSSQQAGMVVPDGFRDHLVVGDVAGWALALIILICLRYRARFTIFLIWVLIAETIIDMGSGTLDGLRTNTMGNLWGTTWLVVAIYVPLMMVSLGLTVWQLLSRCQETLMA
ncbi:MAG TPA: hypothetical protein VK775_14135 [Chthoniobacterales bacterium]|jgi:hypothetical protein|nr:hypothetical protein [Chthoniobacterales bacterium]